MNQPHWILDTDQIEPGGSKVGFRGFLYSRSPADYQSYICSKAKHDPDGFLQNLNGCFCGFVQLKDKIIMFNDRFGYGKVYVHESPGRMIIGSSFNDVVRKLTSRTPNLVAILEFLRFGYPICDYTFLEEVRLLPPGSRLEVDTKTAKLIREQRYWRYEFIEDAPANREQSRERLWQSLENAVEACFADRSMTYVVGNSGGLDSRSILAIAQAKSFDFVPYTFGIPGSDTVRIANEISRTLELPQQNIDIKSDFLPKYYELHIERRPMITLASLWYYSGIEMLPAHDINVVGMYGDNTFGIHLVDKYLKMNNDWDQYHYHSLANDDYLSRVTPLRYDAVKQHYTSVLADYNQPNLIKRFDQWNFENRQFRFIMEEDWVNFLDDMEMRCPFMNNSLVDFAFTIPFEWRRDRRLYQEAISHHFPEVAHIRLERNAYGISDPPWLRNVKSAVWNLAKCMDKLVGWNPYYLGLHKQQRKWLLKEPNYSFIEDNLSRPSRLFTELFHHKKIAANVRSLLETNWSVTSNLLTIKLWLERFVEGSW